MLILMINATFLKFNKVGDEFISKYMYLDRFLEISMAIRQKEKRCQQQQPTNGEG